MTVGLLVIEIKADCEMGGGGGGWVDEVGVLSSQKILRCEDV